MRDTRLELETLAVLNIDVKKAYLIKELFDAIYSQGIADGYKQALEKFTHNTHNK